jgi:signal transduction histidine kinase
MSVLDRVGTLTPDELRQLFLFESLDDEKLEWLAEHGWVAELTTGSTVHAEGEPAEVFVILLSGTISMSRRVGEDDIETTRTDHIGVYTGAVQAYLQDNQAESEQHYLQTCRVVSDARLFVLRGEDFAESVRTWFPMAIHLLEGLFQGLNRSQSIIAQRQQLLALGSLSAGLMHELNNPAAAAVRATSALRQRVEGMRTKLAMLAHHELDPSLLELLVDVQEEAVRAASLAPELSAVEESAREEELAAWLDERGVSGAWELAPIFVAGGTTTDFLDKITTDASQEVVEGGLRWLAYTVETELLLAEITDSVTRISTLVDAARQYSHLDRAAFERVDIHEGLKSTLVMMGSSKLAGIEVVKDFDRSLPPVPLYVGEINQVWTNLIDNAVQAMDGDGTLTLRTSLDGECVRVEIADTGPGIPEGLKRRIFEPFFTTKPVGQGTGLGLDISYRIVVVRHGGDITVESQPGDTRFVVLLPLTERPST